jgi:hypothetical protein
MALGHLAETVGRLLSAMSGTIVHDPEDAMGGVRRHVKIPPQMSRCHLKLPPPKQQEVAGAIEEEQKRVVSPSAEVGLAEERM